MYDIHIHTFSHTHVTHTYIYTYIRIYIICTYTCTTKYAHIHAQPAEAATSRRGAPKFSRPPQILTPLPRNLQHNRTRSLQHRARRLQHISSLMYCSILICPSISVYDILSPHAVSHVQKRHTVLAHHRQDLALSGHILS